jgi:hypothetical protein
MASTIRTIQQLTDTTLNISASKKVTIAVAGTHKQLTVQDIGFAAHEAIALAGDLGTPGMAMFTNLDETNFVELGLEVAATFYPFAKLLPGETAGPFRIGGTLFAKADTAACELDVVIIEE